MKNEQNYRYRVLGEEIKTLDFATCTGAVTVLHSAGTVCVKTKTTRLMKVNGIEYGYAGIGGVGEGGRAHAQSAGRGDEDGRMERAPLLQRPLGSQSPNMRHSGSSCDHPLYSIESTVPVDSGSAGNRLLPLACPCSRFPS